MSKEYFKLILYDNQDGRDCLVKAIPGVLGKSDDESQLKACPIYATLEKGTMTEFLSERVIASSPGDHVSYVMATPCKRADVLRATGSMTDIEKSRFLRNFDKFERLIKEKWESRGTNGYRRSK